MYNSGTNDSTSDGLTVGRDEGFVLRREALVNVGGVRQEPDGHHVVWTGDHRALRLPATKSATQSRLSRPGPGSEHRRCEINRSSDPGPQTFFSRLQI